MSLLPMLLLALAWFAAVNLVVSAIAWTVAGLMLRSVAAPRGSVLLGIRLAPAIASAVFAVALFVPSHWRFEPADARESFGVVLYGLAAIGVGLLGRSLARGSAVMRAGWRLRACQRLPEIDGRLGAYEVPGLAGVSLAGVFRTRVLVGAPIRQALTEAELGVALAHELAHRRALDNVKRCALFCAPDLFAGSATARRLEDQWRATAEWLADARAVAGDSARALHLASALVKVSRLAAAPSRFVSSPAWSTLHEAPLLETRVRRLIAGTAPSAAAPARASRAIVSAAIAIVLLSCAAVPWAFVHHLTEQLVRILP